MKINELTAKVNRELYKAVNSKIEDYAKSDIIIERFTKRYEEIVEAKKFWLDTNKKLEIVKEMTKLYEGVPEDQIVLDLKKKAKQDNIRGQVARMALN